MGHRGEKLEWETHWKTTGSLGHIIDRTGGFDFAIFSEDELAGTIRFKMSERRWIERSSNIGYELRSKFRGRGLITRCLRECINIVYRHLDLDRLEIDGDVNNPKSRAIPERLGFQFEGIKRHVLWEEDKPIDYWLYSMIREDWSSA